MSWTPDPFTVLDNQNKLQQLYTGGTVCHLYTDEQLSADDCKKMVKTVFTNYRLPYLTITNVFSICNDCGYIPGQHTVCPECGSEEVDIWTRVMGYFRLVKSFNIGKTGEQNERRLFRLKESIKKLAA